MYSLHASLIFSCINIFFFLVIKLAADFRGSAGFIVYKKASPHSCTKLGSLTLISKEGKDKFERVSIERLKVNKHVIMFTSLMTLGSNTLFHIIV